MFRLLFGISAHLSSCIAFAGDRQWETAFSVCKISIIFIYIYIKLFLTLFRLLQPYFCLSLLFQKLS